MNYHRLIDNEVHLIIDPILSNDDVIELEQFQEVSKDLGIYEITFFKRNQLGNVLWFESTVPLDIETIVAIKTFPNVDTMTTDEVFSFPSMPLEPLFDSDLINNKVYYVILLAFIIMIIVLIAMSIVFIVLVGFQMKYIESVISDSLASSKSPSESYSDSEVYFSSSERSTPSASPSSDEPKSLPEISYPEYEYDTFRPLAMDDFPTYDGDPAYHGVDLSPEFDIEDHLERQYDYGNEDLEDLTNDFYEIAFSNPCNSSKTIPYEYPKKRPQILHPHTNIYAQNCGPKFFPLSQSSIM